MRLIILTAAVLAVPAVASAQAVNYSWQSYPAPGTRSGHYDAFNRDYGAPERYEELRRAKFDAKVERWMGKADCRMAQDAATQAKRPDVAQAVERICRDQGRT
jgi:hypothetical protein